MSPVNMQRLIGLIFFIKKKYYLRWCRTLLIQDFN